MASHQLARRLPCEASRGFTLLEVLVTLAIMSLLAVVTLGSLTPWLDVRQSFETERKLNETREALRSYYAENALAVEAVATATFGPFQASIADSAGQCAPQATAFGALSGILSEVGARAALDGYNNAFCVLTGPQRSKAVDGFKIFYRTIAIVSVGSNSRLEAGTALNATSDTLALAGDDKGIVVNTYDLAYAKYLETASRMQKVASMYETYFTSRYLQASDRDVSRDYFSSLYDGGGAVASTGGSWAPVATALAGIGVTADLAVSAWQSTPAQSNRIEVGNFNEQVAGVTVRSPAAPTGASLPYTAVLRTRMPSPDTDPQWAVKVAVGQY